MPTSRKHLGFLLGFAGMAMFAGTLPATKLALPAFDPWFLTASRAAIAGLLALALLLALRRPLPPRAAWGTLAAASVFLVIGFPAFAALAMMTAPVAHGGVILGIVPLATAVSAAWLAGERPSAGFWIAAAIGGALVVAFAILHGDVGTFAIGDAFLAGAIGCAALGYTLSARQTMTMPGWEVISWALVAMLPLSLPVLLALWPADMSHVPPSAWAGYIYCVLISQYLGFFAWNAGLAIGGIARVSQVQLFQTFVIVAAAALINREKVDLETVGFAAAVVIAVFVGQRMRVAR